MADERDNNPEQGETPDYGSQVDRAREEGPVTPDAPQESTTGTPIEQEGQVSNPEADDIQPEDVNEAEEDETETDDS